MRLPDVLVQPHSAPLGITVYDGTSFGPEHRGDLFVALHGSWNRAKRTGYKVVRIPLRDGVPTGEYEDFLTGFVASDREVRGRPVGVATARDGALLFSKDGNGTIWRVQRIGRQGYPGQAPALSVTAGVCHTSVPQMSYIGVAMPHAPQHQDDAVGHPSAAEGIRRSHGAFRGKAFRALLRHDPVVARAMAELVSRGAVTGTRSRKISTRVDPGLMEAAKQRFGLDNEADVINASLAVAAAPDRFKAWLRNPQGRLTDDFEPAI